LFAAVATWYRFDPNRNVLCISVYVQPNTRSTEVAGKHGESLKLRVAAPAFEDRANALLIEFLRQKLGVPASRVVIARGKRGRNKTVEILAPGGEALRVIQDWDKT
jgi:uncharacterized protein (TIGR00251 family)